MKKKIQPIETLQEEKSIVLDEQITDLIAHGKGRILEYDTNETLVDIMRSQAKTLPDNTFIVYKDRSFTYKEVDEVTDRLAAHLIRTGIKHEEAVGVMIERSELMFIYSMAVMKAGGTYMPLDSHFPEDRLMFMCEDAGVRIILSDPGIVEQTMPSFGGTVIDSTILPRLTAPAADVRFPKVSPSDRIVILFTSGSMGKPKGVELEQHNLVNFCYWFNDYFKVTEHDKVAAFANFGFDVHQADLWPIMMAGGSMYIIPSDMRLNLPSLHEYIMQESLTIANITTQIGALYASLYPDSSLRALIVAGEKLGYLKKPNYGFYNAYGPTETTIYATCYDVLCDYDSSLIGKAMYNYDVCVVDEAMNVLPVGEAGELIILGEGVARGYLNRPELTAEKFITMFGKKGYHSGDYARLTEDGNIEFLGRIDGQVKLRGLRIELGEVENRVALYPDVQQVCVVVKEVGGQQNLVCYYTEKAPVDTDALKAFIGEKLTAFMVPEIYMRLDAMPLNPNGKVDRKALPTPSFVAAEVEIVPPANDTEKQLFTIAAELLKHDQFGVTTNLLSVGLTSLTAMRLGVMVKLQMDVNLPSGMIMKTPTIRELAYLLTNGQDQATEEQIARVHDKQEYYPLTENQRGLYIDWEMNHEGLQYNLPDVKVIKGHTAEELLSALQKVVAAHPILKMRLANVEGEVMQHRRDDAELPIVCKQLTEEPTAAFFQSRVRPFDLFNDDLCRIEIYTYEGAVFLFTDIHHIIYDGGSTFAFEGDTVKVLKGESLTTETYTAYDRALDEQEMHQMPMYEKAETYFDNLMAEGYEIASYPHSTQPENGTAGTMHAVATMDSQAVKDFCKANSVTESTFFMTVVGQTLHCLLREDDLLFTSITNGRMTPEMHNIIGMFVQTLPVISHVAKGTVAETMRKVQEQYVLTQENSLMPYAKVVEKYGMKSEIMFAFQGGAGTLLEKNEEDAKYAVTTDTAMFPLLIQIIPQGENYNIDIEFDTMLYNAADVQTLAEAIHSLSVEVTEHATSTFSTLPLVNTSQTASLVGLGKGRILDFDRTETLVDIMRRQAKEHPDNTFIVFKNRQLTYKEADELTDRLAAHLIRSGLQHEQAVGVMIERSELMLVYSMAVMKAGGTYMPLDSHFPEDRLMFMCEDADVKYILSDDGLVQKTLPAYGGTIFEGSQIASLPSTDDVTFPEIKANDRMVILFTSGSTGKPKGVELEQHGIVNYCHWYVDEFDMTPADKAVAYANYGFDAHMIDLYPTMLAGASVHILSEDIRLDLVAMHEYIEANQLTIAFMTTQIGCQMASMFESKSLRVLSTGGEKMPPMTPPSYRFVNPYGPTECSLFSTIYDVKSYFEGEFIGRAIANYQLYVIDKEKNLVPEGVAGELLIAGTGVARGYLNSPELTAEKFIEFNGERAYRSGDLVRWATDPRDGSKQIEFLGRIDGQVKLRGLRIELGEVENRVAAYPAIRQVCVDVKEIGGQQNLVCYYTLKNDNPSLREPQDKLSSGQAQDDNEDFNEKLKAFISETLTAFMVPEVYVKLDAMPLTPNGKVNRKALPVPEMAVEATEMILPETETEKQIFDIAVQILKHDQFGVTTNLLTVGLTSLTSMRLSAMIQQKLGVAVQTKSIMSKPTIREMAENLNTSSAPVAAAKAHAIQEYYPLTDNQRGLYVDWELNRGTTQYNIPFAEKWDGCTAEQLVAALTQVVQAHPILKARLAMVNGETVLQRRDSYSLTIQHERLEAAPTQEFFQALVRPFDLFEDDLCRLTVYTFKDAVYLFTDIHHIIYDGGSSFVFMNDLKRALAGEELTAETYTSFDNALDEQERIASPAFANAEKYMDSLMSDYEVASYPRSTQPDTEEASANQLSVNVKGETITKFCHEHGVTLNSFFMAMTTQALHRLLRLDRMLITSITSGRDKTELLDIIGMFVQTLPVVTAMSNASVIETVKDVQRQYIETQGNSLFGYTRIAEKYGAHADIMFVYQGGAGSEELLHNNLKLNRAKAPISVMAIPQENDYQIVIDYDTSLFASADMTTLGKVIACLPEHAAADSQAPMATLPLVTEEGAASIIAMSYGGDLTYNSEETLVDKVIRQAQSQPDALAVVDNRSRYTYQELDAASNAIAQRLIAEGVQPDEFVCIMLPRRKEFVAAVIGVMKAGAAYVPVDMEYPEDRRQYMQEDSEAKVVITEEWLANNDNPSTSSGQAHDDVNLAKPSGRAYMIYTSGSTGKPKGVVIHHEAITACAAWLLPEFGLKPGKKNLHHPSFSFDASTYDLFYPLMAGAEIHILDENQRKDMDFMAAYILENGITGMTMSTALGMALLNQYNLDIEYIMLGGEKFLPVKKTNTRLYNGYGPTEFTVCSSFHIIDQDKDMDIPIGRAVPNTYSFICDRSGNLLPQGVMGELCLAGPQIAECYWHREELTTEKFCAIPFAGSNPSLKRMYRTGDLARYNADGELEFCGRIDNQVKLRGFRIELGEIENAAKTFAGIMDVAAEVHKINGQDMLCLYYTAETEIDKAQLSSSLSSSLTDYMVPNVFVQMEAMPLTPNGKVNRKALPVPEMEVADLENVAPATTRETTLLNIVRELLGREDFGVTDGLKELGMTSLTAIKFAARAKQEGIMLKVGDIMHHNTVRNLSQAMMAVASWFAPYDPSKPIIVLVSGIITRDMNQPRMECWSQRYNILFIEPIDEHYSYLFTGGEGYDDVAAFYYDLVDTYAIMNPEIQTDIIAFGGFCLGGFIGYSLALLYQQATGKKAKVILGDSASSYVGAVPMTTEADYEESYNNTIGALEMAMRQTKREGQSEEEFKEEVSGLTRLMVTKFDISTRVAAGAFIPENDLEAILFNAYEGRDINNFPDMWKPLTPHLKIINLATDHFSFCLNMGNAWTENVCNAVIEFVQQS